MKFCQRLAQSAVVLLIALTFAGLAQAQVMTLPDAQALFPQYTMTQSDPGAFQTPCIDAQGTMTIVASVGDITQDSIAVGMVCQAIGYPPYQAGGTVTFDVPGAFLISHAQVPGFPDAFSLDFGIPLGTQTITITITNTGWPEGCIDPADFLDFAGFDAQSVDNEQMSWGAVQSLYR